MAKYMYERLSAQDNSFLVAEQAHAPKHEGADAIYELGDLATPEGGVDIRRFKRATEAQLHRIPRYRQKLMWVPIENRPVWIDDPHFNIDYHVRHTALPKPGGIEELKSLTARITTRSLDRKRPLWEIWVIEGLQGGRFAIVNKIHHCMIDGASGADVAQILMSPSPEHEIEEPRPYVARPAPGEDELLLDAIKHNLGMPLRALQGLNAFRRETGNVLDEVGTRVRAIVEALGSAVHTSSDTPINGALGPHRRIDWLTLPLADVKAVRRSLGCTVNDVVLGTVTGAIRHYLMRRGVDPAELDFRVSAPVNVRSKEDKGKLGNRVSTWIVKLPVDEALPGGWIEGVSAATRELKSSNQALAVDMLMRAAEYAPPALMAMGARAAAGPINMIVTNVPGPQFPLYILGARLLEMHPLVPLLEGSGLGVALFSYDGKLHVGLNAEYDLIPDLGTFTALFAQAFMTIHDSAGLEPVVPAEAADSGQVTEHREVTEPAPVNGEAVGTEPIAYSASST
jgi:diacylglycerol O-acyltransferase